MQEQLADPPFGTEKLDTLMDVAGIEATTGSRSSAMPDDC
jgi:hypothetical protein